jgi:hypothetical protein
VKERKHSRKKDAECLCTFILSWSHGPNVGKLTSAEICNICLVQPVLEYDPAVASFLDITRRRIESQSGQEMVVYCNTGIDANNHTEIKTKSKMGYFERMQKVSSVCIFMFHEYFPLVCMLRK